MLFPLLVIVQVDMNLIVICESIMKLQPLKKMNLMMMNESLDLDANCRHCSGGV